MLARIGLANYFAGALILPYGDFLRAAEAQLEHPFNPFLYFNFR